MIDCLRSCYRGKGLCPPGCTSSSLNDVAVRDCQLRRTSKTYKDAQNRWEGQDLPRTYLAHHEPDSIITIIIIFFSMWSCISVLILHLLEGHWGLGGFAHTRGGPSSHGRS